MDDGSATDRINSDSSTSIISKEVTKNSIYHRLKTFPSSEAANIIDTTLFPTNEYTNRLKIARDAQFKSTSTNIGDDNDNNNDNDSGRIMSASDPRLSFTYDEFPVQSMDLLLDVAVEEYKKLHGTDQQPNVLVDLGSGCGRLVLYAALCNRDSTAENGCGDGDGDGGDGELIFHHIHGIEISQELHEIGQGALERGVEEGYFKHAASTSNTQMDMSSVCLHLGRADELGDILRQADVIFSYSTVFDTKGFSEEMGAMILSDEWSKMLADNCREGCVVVTTDRALNPQFGWTLKRSIEVDNPKLFGTTGYVSILL
eukprot:CAMPEP_0203677702 /NCGR_PEP_ID=MMETSP0090-20130426/29183_1 /ASSEMBLY_ACC=CAM_ASM_001088 /TAXON_ID=426623 /ORGANISM="Chaetoceros affinis, Strain CCMP159" /LENGTH=314 /DNA_ID=CAMNT_0050544669 /DNA_START=130 /DNA_END=1074 /DNA_ORIENTATION=+